MQATNDRIPSVPQFRPFLREKLCGTDGRGLKFPLPPTVPVELGTDRERTGTDGNGRTGNGCRPGAEKHGSTETYSAIVFYGEAREIGPAPHPTHQKSSLCARADPKNRPGAFPGATDA